MIDNYYMYNEILYGHSVNSHFYLICDALLISCACDYKFFLRQVSIFESMSGREAEIMYKTFWI